MLPIEPDTDISYLIEQKKAGKHRCLTGSFVKLYSLRAKSDLEKRIADAIHTRDHETHRSDARTYYNGILNVLRRKLRDVNRELTKSGLIEVHTIPLERRRSCRDRTHSSRLLKLSGLL